MRVNRGQLVAAAERVLPAPVMRRLRVAKFDRERKHYRRRVVEHDYGGVRHKVEIGSIYGERYDSDWPELQEVAWLRRHGLREGARVFNLGASYGVVAMMLADAVGPSGEVVALEAHPEDAANLERNKQLNDLPQLRCVHAAVARESGEIAFGRNGEVDDGSHRWGDLRVPSYSIDDLAERYGAPDVVFIDVEGYEHEALAGASKTIAAGPDWFVEVHGEEMLGKYGGSVADVIRIFEDAGYELSAAPDAGYSRRKDGTIVPAWPIGPLRQLADELRRGRFFLLATRR